LGRSDLCDGKKASTKDERTPEETDGKEIIILSIPDDYQYMDEDLIEELTSKVSDYL
jgi:protein-tyrosine phosphatase